MIDIQALSEAVKASIQSTPRFFTNCLILPVQLKNLAPQIIWADERVPAAYILDAGDFYRYYFFANPQLQSGLSLPKFIEKPLIAEVYYPSKAAENRDLADRLLTSAHFQFSASFMRMTLKSSPAAPSLQAPYRFSIAPDPRCVSRLWHSCIGDMTELPDSDTCQALIHDHLVYAIEWNGQTVAAMLIEKQGRRITLRHVAVAPDHRRKNLARALVQFALSFQPEGTHALLWVETGNHPAVSLYQSLGFSPDGLMSAQWKFQPHPTKEGHL